MPVPTVVSRSQWSARPFKGKVQSLGTVRHIVVHHAAGYAAQTLDEGKRRVREIQALHQDDRKWSDIGYHFLIDARGVIYQGRPFYKGASLAEVPKLAMGAHVLNQNAGKVGICLLGCFHPPENNCDDTPSAEAMETLEYLIRHVCASYAVSAATIRAHRDFLNTACPGDRLYSLVQALHRKLVDEGL